MTAADSVIAYGYQEIGEPYVWGAEGPNAFDCSGLILYIFEKIGVKLPRTAADQQKSVSPVSAPKPGDLVFWGSPAYHVALYVGGGKVLSAPHAGANVRVQDIWGSPTFGRVAGVNTTAATAVGFVQPVAAAADGVLDKLSGFGKIILFAGAGAALVILGAFKVVKGDS